MDDSEDEELEALRRERQERLGHAGVVRAGEHPQYFNRMMSCIFSVFDDFDAY